MPLHTAQTGARVREWDVRHLHFKIGVIGAAMLCAMAPWPAAWVETYYSRGAYPAIQFVVTAASNLLPVAWLDLAAGLAAFVVLTWPIRLWRAGRGRRVRACGRSCLHACTAAAAVYLAFLFAWGLNYRREPVSSRLEFDEARVSAAAAVRMADVAMTQLSGIAPLGSRPWPARSLAETAASLQPHVDEWMSALGAQHTMLPGRPKRSVFDPFFTRAGVSGMTDPWFLETFVASDVLPFEQPAVIAHEWAHLAGWATEAEASFAGFVLCLRGDDAARYSGWFAIFMDVIGQVDAPERQRLSSRLPDAVRRDWRAAAERTQRNRAPAVGHIAWRTYDTYLKSNRVDSGVRNYSEVVRLVLGTQFDREWRPVLRK